jgi:hypothetical protein
MCVLRYKLARWWQTRVWDVIVELELRHTLALFVNMSCFASKCWQHRTSVIGSRGPAL